MTHICWSARPTGHAGCFFIRASLPPSAFLVRQPISPSFLPAGWREGRKRDGRGTGEGRRVISFIRSKLALACGGGLHALAHACPLPMCAILHTDT